MFIVYPTNIDYLIDAVRLHTGDYGEVYRFSDSVVRTALVGSVKMLQRRWHNRYLVYTTGMVVDPLPLDKIYEVDYNTVIAASGDVSGKTVIPSGYLYGKVVEGFAYIPSGLNDNDILRNPYETFLDPGSAIISQEDEHAIILASSLIIRKSQLSSNADSFMVWTDGEYSYSNIGASKAMKDLYDGDTSELDQFFKKRLSPPLRSEFDYVNVPALGLIY